MNCRSTKVTITKVTSFCGCTTVALEKKTYRPGESGRIRATFEVGHRSGKQTKRIVVRTDAAGAPATTLTLRADIPELLRLSRRFVFWKADEPREAKTIELTVVHDEPVNRLRHVSPALGSIRQRSQSIVQALGVRCGSLTIHPHRSLFAGAVVGFTQPGMPTHGPGVLSCRWPLFGFTRGDDKTSQVLGEPLHTCPAP